MGGKTWSRTHVTALTVTAAGVCFAFRRLAFLVNLIVSCRSDMCRCLSSVRVHVQASVVIPVTHQPWPPPCKANGLGFALICKRLKEISSWAVTVNALCVSRHSVKAGVVSDLDVCLDFPLKGKRDTRNGKSGS